MSIILKLPLKFYLTLNEFTTWSKIASDALNEVSLSAKP
jgi:hypothetical protein